MSSPETRSSNFEHSFSHESNPVDWIEREIGGLWDGLPAAAKAGLGITAAIGAGVAADYVLHGKPPIQTAKIIEGFGSKAFRIAEGELTSSAAGSKAAMQIDAPRFMPISEEKPILLNEHETDSEISFDKTGLHHPSGAFDGFTFTQIPHARAQQFKFNWEYRGDYDQVKEALEKAGFEHRKGAHLGKIEWRSESSNRGQVHFLVEMHRSDESAEHPLIRGSVHGFEYDPLKHPLEHMMHDMLPLAFERRELPQLSVGDATRPPVLIDGQVTDQPPPLDVQPK